MSERGLEREKEREREREREREKEKERERERERESEREKAAPFNQHWLGQPGSFASATQTWVQFL